MTGVVRSRKGVRLKDFWKSTSRLCALLEIAFICGIKRTALDVQKE
jgi:hypothetical protein